MISVRVKTQSLEVAISSPQDRLADIVQAAITVAESPPIQSSLQAPIIIRPLDGMNNTAPKQLPLFDNPSNHQTVEQPRRRSPKGKGERIVAYNKTRELIEKDFFETGKAIKDIRQALSKMGYPISSDKLADALLILVRDSILVREGEPGSYLYRKPSQ